MILDKCFTQIFDFLFQFEVMADFVLPYITMGKRNIVGAVTQSTPIHMAEGVN